MKRVSQTKLEANLRQMFFDGRLHAGNFDMYSSEGREAAARQLAAELVKTDMRPQ